VKRAKGYIFISSYAAWRNNPGFFSNHDEDDDHSRYT